MNREQMVAQAKIDILDYFVDVTPDARDAEYAARQIVATLLPQVSTVADLEALPVGTKLLDGEGRVWEKYQPKGSNWAKSFGAAWRDISGYYQVLNVHMDLREALTVVWTPEAGERS